MCFLCRNKSSVESLSHLVIHTHQGSIYSACFSHDGAKIASCGTSKTLKVTKHKCLCVKGQIVSIETEYYIYCKYLLFVVRDMHK